MRCMYWLSISIFPSSASLQVLRIMQAYVEYRTNVRESRGSDFQHYIEKLYVLLQIICLVFTLEIIKDL